MYDYKSPPFLNRFSYITLTHIQFNCHACRSLASNCLGHIIADLAVITDLFFITCMQVVNCAAVIFSSARIMCGSVLISVTFHALARPQVSLYYYCH